MSDKFKCPNPSEAALGAASRSFGQDPSCGVPPTVFLWDALRHGYHVDVPRIVKAEVERALASFSEPGVQSVVTDLAAKYVRERFGEGECDHQWATETSTFGKTYCIKCKAVQRDPFSVSSVLNERLEPGYCPTCEGPCRVVMGEPHRVYPRAMTDRAEAIFLEGDRATLAKLERFCTALAKVVDDDPYAWPIESVRAAREYLR